MRVQLRSPGGGGSLAGAEGERRVELAGREGAGRAAGREMERGLVEQQSQLFSLFAASAEGAGAICSR